MESELKRSIQNNLEVSNLVSVFSSMSLRKIGNISGGKQGFRGMLKSVLDMSFCGLCEMVQ